MTAVPSYPADLVLVPRRPRRVRLLIAVLVALAVVLVVLDVRATPRATPAPRPTPVAHIVAKPKPAAAPRLSIAGKTYACTVIPPKPAKH